MQSVQELKDIAVRVGYARAWADETFASSIIPIFQNVSFLFFSFFHSFSPLNLIFFL